MNRGHAKERTKLLDDKTMGIPGGINTPVAYLIGDDVDTLEREIRLFHCAEELMLYGRLANGREEEMARKLEREANCLIALSYRQGNLRVRDDGMAHMPKTTYGGTLMPQAHAYISKVFATPESALRELWCTFGQMLQYSSYVRSIDRTPSRSVWETFADLLIDMRVLIAGLKYQAILDGRSWKAEYPCLQGMIDTINVYSPMIGKDGSLEYAALGAIAKHIYLRELKEVF